MSQKEGTVYAKALRREGLGVWGLCGWDLFKERDLEVRQRERQAQASTIGSSGMFS